MSAALDESQLLPLLETLEDASTSHTEKTDAYLSIANRLSGEDGKEFTALVGKQFSRLCKSFKTHIAHQHSDLSNAALQTLGFCVFNSSIASEVSASVVQELLSTLNSIAVKDADKNSCTRALWVISKQNFSPEEVGKVVPLILSTLENVLNKDGQSLVIAYEALNVILRLLEQTPTQMTSEAVRWAKLIIPLVVHSAPKVRIRAATVLEIGVPLLLQKQQEVSTLTEQLMTSKIIAELQKLFTCKNETYVLKLWPLFVKLLGKTLHRSGSFINSLLQLEELGFRSGTPAVKKIAFIAWKSLIDNFALNPDILCSSKRLKLLMQPLNSISVKTELLALTKIEVWWYLLMRLGAQLPAHFEQVCLPLLQSALSVDSSSTPSRSSNQNLTLSTPQKGNFPFGSPTTPKMNLNSSLLASVAFPSVHLLGVEMMLHFLLGPAVGQFAARHKLGLSLEPLQHRLISSSSFFSKHASSLLGAVQDGFITIGKDASGVVLHAVWKDMIEFVKAAMETGSKKERQGSEVLTFLLQTLKNIIVSDALQVEKSLSLLECTVKGLPQKVLASAAYQGTPALFLIQLHFHPGLLEHGVKEERFFINYETLVTYVFSGPTSPLAFSESVLQELNQGAKLLENKELLWRMWSILINPLTEKINQTNEVNQGDALEHNFSALHSALMLPINHIFPVAEIPQPTMKTLLRTWSELYKAFSRCAALVTTTDENVCCEELCSRILAAYGDQTLDLPLLERLVQVIGVIVECVNFSPFSTKFQPKTKSPLTPTDWAKKKKGPLGNLLSVLKLLEKLIEGFHALCSDQSLIEAGGPTLTAVGSSIVGCVSTCISHISLPSVLTTVFSSLTKPISVFYAKTKSESPKVYSSLSSKLDKLLGDALACLGSRYTGSYDNELLEILSPLLGAVFLHKSKAFRNQVTQFWNGSFAKAAVLVYPEELKPILSQVKLKTPILLPGFTCSNPAEESTGVYSDNMDSSEFGTKISGIEVKSAGKRDSLLARTEEIKGTPTKLPQAKLKLDFSSPNTKKRLLEEEKSVDFVFIPPETKERVLTEHQKEVLRTKRVDIPTMYNNLDASQDTTLFTQYTQSQESSLEKPDVLDIPKEAVSEAKEDKTEDMNTSEATTKDEKTAREVIDVEMLEDDAKTIDSTNEGQNESNISNGSASSDLVSGTPPSAVKRRQSFITLEKFESPGNRSLSPLANKKFVKSKEVILVPDSQEAADTTTKDSENLEKDERTSQTPTKQNLKNTSKSATKRETRASRAAELAESQTSTSQDDNQKSSKAAENIGDKMEENDTVPESQPSQGDEKAEELNKGKTVANNKVDTKENTPPDAEDTALTKGNPQTPTNQITLRRSSRRQSEVLDAVKNENESENRTKEEPKMTKKTPTARETPKKQQSEILVKSEVKDWNISSNPEDISSITSNCHKDEELPDSNSSKESQEKTNNGPRYKTRRSSQSVVVPDVENSESTLTETQEVSIKKKRRGRPRSIERSEKAEFSQESPSEIEVSLKSPDESSNIRDIDNKTYTVSDYSSRSKVLKFEPDDQLDSKLNTTEFCKTYDLSKSEVSDTATESLMTEPTAGDFSTAVSDVFQSSQSGLQNIHCSHKRSKRIRKSKNCDCCFESPKDLKSGEPEGNNQKGNMSTSMQLNDTFSIPCAISTPLANEQVFFKSAGEVRSDTESEQEQTIAPLSDSNIETDEITQVFVPRKEAEATETSSEIIMDETVVAASPKEAKDETVVSVQESVVNNGEDEEMEVAEVNQETTSCKTFDVAVNDDEDKEMEVAEVNGETTSYKTFAIAENDGEDKETEVIEVNQETASCKTFDVSVNDSPTSSTSDEKPEEDLENGQVILDEEDGKEINNAEAVLGGIKDGVEEVEEQTGPVDETEVVTINTDVNEDPAETIAEVSDAGATQIDVLPDEEKVDEEKVDEAAAPKTTEKMVLDGLVEGHSNIDSPPKAKGLTSMVLANDSPSGSFSWSPSASPSTSILKKGLKRQQEIESPSPINKIRRVSFADPIYQEELADDIDRRSPVIRNSSSPAARSLKLSSGNQPKVNTTPTKGFVSPGARVLGFKSSKKSLISEMTKESMPSPKESVYPALMNCTTTIDVILPQITSNMWARGVGQLIRAKNIKTIGDLSTLTPCEIKTLPIRSPKISTVKKALRIYHEQQTKCKGYDEFAALDEAEKALNGVDEKSAPVDEEKIETDLPEASATAVVHEASATPDILAQINALSLLFTQEELGKYSGSQLFEMQDKLGMISNCVLRHLQCRWRSPPHDGSV
ncbi:telomere-associated protein RIF1 isoform 2-T2 [Anomaloglossus baeobatrachus]|uniref:telomere-associated protein RIF1 isoform X2 n=1 Tax=Anomaloglossus baeobatrachus TaxID=238106 RepID=UPI003F4F4AC0